MIFPAMASLITQLNVLSSRILEIYLNNNDVLSFSSVVKYCTPFNDKFKS